MCTGITCDITGEPARLEADARNRRLGPLVQHPPPPPRPGRHHTTTSRKPTHNNTKGSGLNKPPQNPGLDTPGSRSTPPRPPLSAGSTPGLDTSGSRSTPRQHAGGQLLMLQTPPTAQFKTVAHGRILTVLLESAPAGQVAVAGAVERPESDNGNHPSKSRTQFNAVIFRDGPQTLQFQRPHFNV